MCKNLEVQKLFTEPIWNKTRKENKFKVFVFYNDISVIFDYSFTPKEKKMNTDQLQLMINLHGSREVSIKLINSRIYKILGMDMSDLPDTSELCDTIDELQELLETENYKIEDIKSILDSIDIEFIEQMVLG